ncbi:MAG: hypothetical protein ACAI44_04220 [Candidatus Sericytochromatia bacterium]
MEMLRNLSSLRQIQLALEYRGYQVRQPQDGQLLVTPPGQQQLQFRLCYLDQLLSGSQNQLLELQMPLGLRPDAEQKRALASVLAALSGSLGGQSGCGGMALVFGPEGLALRTCWLHPRQLPDLRSLLQQIKNVIRAWFLTYSLLAPYVMGQLSIRQLRARLS